MEFKDFSRSINHTKLDKFADYLASGKIMGTTCKKCGSRYYPPRADCKKCFSDGMDWVELKGRGKLITFTSINVPPDYFDVGFKNLTPPFSKARYTACPIGILRLDNGLSIMGWIPGIALKEISVGLELVAVPVTLPDGTVTIKLCD